MSVILTSRFLSFLPESANSPGGKRSFQIIQEGAGRLGLTTIRREPFFFSCETNHSVNRPGDLGQLVLDVFPGTAASRRCFKCDPLQQGWSSWHEIAARQAQFYNLIQLNSDGFRLESDPMGLKPFYLARLPGGLVLASRIRDLVRLFPDLVRPVDPAGLYGLLVLKSPPSDRTLHEKIRRSASGACYHWKSETGLQITRERRLNIPEVDPAVSMETALERIKNVMTTSLRQRVSELDRPVILALSGGFDSRLLAGLSRDLGIPMKAVTYGRAHHREVQIARRVAQTLKLDHQILPYPEDNLLNRLSLHLEVLEGQADLGVLQMANLLNLSGPLGTPLVHGFLGGVLAGQRVDRVREETCGSSDRLVEGILLGYAEGLSFDERSLLGLEFLQDAYRDALRADLPNGCHPYQALVVWDLENRQRRFVSSALGLAAHWFDVIAPSYRPEVIQAWLSLPRIALEHRTLFRSLLARYFPEMAKIPHTSEVHPVTPNLKHQIPLFVRWSLTKMTKRILGREWYLRLLHPDIDLVWSSLTHAQKIHMHFRIKTLRPEMEMMLGLKPAEDMERALDGNPQFTRNLFLVAEYAARLADSKRLEVP